MELTATSGIVWQAVQRRPHSSVLRVLLLQQVAITCTQPVQVVVKEQLHRP